MESPSAAAIVQGTLTADSRHVFHNNQWIPALISPDCNWYAYDNQWHPLNPNSVALANTLKINNSTQNKTSVRESSSLNSMLIRFVCLLLMMVLLWYVFDPGGRGLAGYHFLELSWWELANCKQELCDGARGTAIGHVTASASIFIFLQIMLIIEYFGIGENWN